MTHTTTLRDILTGLASSTIVSDGGEDWAIDNLLCELELGDAAADLDGDPTLLDRDATITHKGIHLLDSDGYIISPPAFFFR